MSQSLATRAARLALLVGVLGGAGCVSAATVQIPHPMRTGGVAPNRVPNPDNSTASYFGLPPGTFTDEASLLSVDPQRVCFAVTLRVDGDHANLATIGQWRTFMRGDPNVENMQPVFGPPAAQQVVPMQGSIPQRQFAGYQTICTRYSYGVQCSQQPRYVTVRVPAVVNVVTGGGTVCFAHGGQVNPRTEQITLHMDDPANVSRRLAFRWRFN